MRIKRLEIQGFKSFPDRTIFKFQENGLTGVVGPNGCGKSNVVDAVRWALGEQSPKLLRGSLMEDVIFNGSERRKPLGLAEVSLVFENNGTMKGPWQEYSEVIVSRRLYRSGESDYLINGVPCRLRDVRELLADAGGSSRGYSIVEQGRISLLINSRPEEKRALIEEAAGVLKYRMRRTEAERKLDKTRQNLLRVADVTREVKRQFDGMQRNAEKARRYRELRAELDRLVLRQRFHAFSEAGAALASLEVDFTRRKGDLEKKQAALAAMEAREETLRLALAEREERFGRLFEQVRKSEAEIARMEGDISVRESSIRALEERIGRLASDLSELDQKKESERGGIVQLELTLAGIDEEHVRSQEVLAAAEGEFAAAEADLAESTRLVEELRARLFALGTDRSRALSDREAHERALNALARRANENSVRVSDLARRLDGLSSSREEKERSRRRLQEERDSLLDGLRRKKVSLESAKGGSSALEKDLMVRSERIAELRGLLHTLSSLEEDLEGFSEGVRTVIREYAASGGEAGILGVVADNIEVPSRFEKAVLAVLGERLQQVIVKAPEDGLSAVSFLKQRSVGRGSFIPQAPRTNGKGNGNGLPRGEGIIGTLTELVSFPDHLKGMGEALLGGAVVVEDIDQALTLWRSNGHTATLVTLDGDVVEPTGVVTGGSVEGRETDLLSRKRRLREAKEELGAEESLASSSRARLDGLRAAIFTLEEEISSLEASHREAERAHMAEEGALAVLAGEADHLAQVLRDLSLEGDLLASERDEISARSAELEGRIVALEKEEAEARAALQEHMAGQEEAGRRVNAHRATLEEARFSLSTVDLRRENSSHALEGARNRTLELDDRKARLGEEMEDARSRIAAHRETIGRERGEVRTLAEELEAGQRDLTGVREAQETARAETEVLTGMVRSARSEIAASLGEITALELRLHDLRSERENLSLRAREEHLCDLSSLTVEGFGEEDFDPAEAPERIARLRERIGSLGDVNPGAVEEFEELRSRLTFLTAQKDDLEQSIAALARAIRRINRASRELFLSTFRLVKERFAQVLPLLYEGSRGEMVLLDEEDPLNSGVEIHVSPPGKKLRSMQLLSGGEKALVSLAMIFTIFLVKPSPFCILDEVDAPLDDRNLDNTVQFLKGLAASYQFLVITHNKQTMEAADILYGVTMREPGVSQVVSVQLKEEGAAA